MRHCLNPACLHPSNPESHQFCVKCGQKLLLRERYWAKKIIGQGGFGRTFLAVDEDKPSKPFCVIKQLLPQAQGTASLGKAAELFAQEAEQLEQLGHHPQIPELLAYFTDEGQQYLVQEFVNGKTLDQELAENGVFSEPQIRELLIDVLGILDFVHGKNVIHRDVKPDNIIRKSSDQKLVLVDFGAAKVLKQVQRTVTGTIIGAPEYCAPEQAMGKAKFISDLYSLGVTCLHLLTQMSPFDLYDSDEMEWAWRDFLNGNAVSDELGQILDHLIQQAPKRRSQSAQAVLQDLQPSAVRSPQTPQTSSSLPKTQTRPASLRVPKRYQRLAELLKAGDWRNADQETVKQILAVANRTEEGWLDIDNIKKFPCEDLRAIDQLWVNYSQGRFGFSIQKRIYQTLGGTRQYDEQVWKAFGDAVGWRKRQSWLSYKDLTFNTQAPEGHLPGLCVGGEWWVWWRGFWGGSKEIGSSFASRLADCNI